MSKHMENKDITRPMDHVTNNSYSEKGDSIKCLNYRTLSLIPYPRKIQLRIILNRLIPQAEQILAE